MSAKFIVFEGIDGSGKTTQANLLTNNMHAAGYKFWTTRECTNGPIGTLIKADYLSGERSTDESIINLLMAADRLEHVTSDSGIVSNINSGRHVICDRFVLSGLAYDNYDSDDIEAGFAHTMEVNRAAMDMIRPDITIYLDLDPKKSMERISGRGGSEVYEHYEKLVKIHDAYTEAFAYVKQHDYDCNVCTIDASLDFDTISAQVWKAVKAVL